MNQKCKNGFVKRLSNETRPLHVLLHNQTLACFPPEVKKILHISNIARLLQLSKSGSSSPGYENIPVLSPDKVENGLVIFANHSSVRHPSAFFQLVVKTSKPSSVSMARWLTREILPMIDRFKTPLVTITNDPELKELIGRHKSRIEGQVLIDLGGIRVTGGNKSPEFACKDKTSKGGDDV